MSLNTRLLKFPMHKLAIIYFILFSAVHAQVNTESLKKWDSTKSRSHEAQFSTTIVAGNSEYQAYGLKYRTDYILNQSLAKPMGTARLFWVADYDTKMAEKTYLVNKGFFHLRYSHDLSPRLQIEPFIQVQFNDFTLLTNRQLAGLTLRQEILNSKHFLLTGSAGFMHEMERRVGYGALNYVRLTSYLLASYTFSSGARWQGTLYYQPRLSAFTDDFRILLDSSLAVPITQALYLTTTLNIQYDSLTLSQLKQTDSVLKQGLSLVF